MTKRTGALIHLCLALTVTPGSAQESQPCADDPGFAALDFWVGAWTVWSGGQQVGTNLIRKVQDGCAIEEHWEGAGGGTGQSLFYYLPASSQWKQVWVTPFARAAGGIKEKTLVEAPAGSVRFRGSIERGDGTTYLDQTTLTPLDGGRVRQRIEVSSDGGETWTTTFDAQYRPASGPVSLGEVGNRIHEYLSREVAEASIPGLTAAVVRDGELVYAGAFGVRELGSDEALTPRHVFHFASVSKPFVATAILQLAEQGRIGLEDRLIDHLPYFRLADERYRQITIRHMLNHTAGMVDVDDYEWDAPQYDDGAAERFVREMATDSMLWSPGGGWQYSNKAFDALGDVIAKVSGVSFEEYVQSHILDPIGMEASSFIHPEIEESLRTTGHVGTPARVSDVYPYNRRHAPSPTLNSSVEEMVNWMLVNLNRGELRGRRILEDESYDILWEPAADTPREGMRVGLSWFLGELEGERTVAHGGGDTGFRSYILLIPDAGIGIVMASNWSGTDTGVLSNGIARMLLP